MLAPINYSSIESALDSPTGWGELAAVTACFAIGWLLERRVWWKSASGVRGIRVGVGSVTRMVFPVTTLVLLVIARAIFQRWSVPPFFTSIALPLTVALAFIRLLVYGMRELFGAPAWLPASERAVAFTIWGLVLLYFTGVLGELANELSAMYLPIGARQVSVYDIVRGMLAVLVTLAVTLWLSSLIERRLLRAPNLDTSLRTVLGKFLRALLLVMGILFALQAVGIDLTLLSVFGGALGVGIGLGLQKMASNYIAGFTILLDRSIRLGDMISVDNRTGIVSKVTSRYVVVRSLDGIEAIVPNETLVTTTVLNYAYSTREVRLGLPVQITYDSDVEMALKLMADVARTEPRVLQVPNGPEGFVVRFADNGIDLELGLWINDPENGQLNLKSALNRGIWKKFREHGIKISSPQREFRLIAAGSAANSPSTPPAATIAGATASGSESR